jgi:hypothetical protein
MRLTIHIFGETHGFADDIFAEAAVLEKVKAEFFLFERLEEKTLISLHEQARFMKNKDHGQFSIISTYSDLKPTVELAIKYKLKLIGCDIKNMGRKNASFLQQSKLSAKQRAFESNLLKKRELHQAKKILEHAKKTKKPLFVILGAYHLRKNSHALQALQGQDVILYLPTNNNRIVLGPSPGMNPEEIEFKKYGLKEYLL